MANQSPSSLFLDQGQGFWGALKERYPWLTPAQIQALLPQVQAMNPNITDIGIGYPGEPYNIPYIPKPPGYIREYDDPEDVRAYGEQEAGAMRSFLAKSPSARNSALDVEYEKTASVARLARAFGVNVSVPTRRQGARSTADPAKGVANKTANRKYFEDLMAFSAQVGGRITSDELREFMTSINAGEDQWKALESSGHWKHLNLGDLVPMYWIEDNELKISWHNKNDVTDIQIQRANNKTLKKEDAEAKRGFEIKKDKVFIVEAARAYNKGKGIRTHEDFTKFRTDNATVLSKDPETLASLKGVIPDALWQRGKMEPLFRKNADGTITVRDFEVGDAKYNDGLSSGEWSRKIEQVLVNERQKARALYLKVVNENTDLDEPALRNLFLAKAHQQGIIGSEDLNLATYFDDWYQGDKRNKGRLQRELSTALQYINEPPTAAKIKEIRRVLSTMHPETQKKFWEQYNQRFEYSDTEPRRLYHPTSGEESPFITTWAERFMWEDKGYTSEVPIDTRPAFEKKLAQRHIPITDAIKDAGTGAKTFLYVGQELSENDAKAFLDKFPSGIERWTPNAQREFQSDYRKSKEKWLEKPEGKQPGLAFLDAEIQTIIRLIRQGGAAQIAALKRIEKLYDPDSAVREGEVDLLMSLEPIFGKLKTLIQKATGDIKILSDPVMQELEMAAYVYWKTRTDFLRDRLGEDKIDYDSFNLPDPYKLGGPSPSDFARGVERDMGELPVLGEGVKTSWEETVGNKAARYLDGDNFDPYLVLGITPLEDVRSDYVNPSIYDTLISRLFGRSDPERQRKKSRYSILLPDG